MRRFTIDKFRNLIPRRPVGTKLPEYPPERVARLLKLARKHASVLKHANEGYTTQLEKILRNTWGRSGPRKYDLLTKYLYPSAKEASGDPPKLLLDRNGNETDVRESDDGGDLEESPETDEDVEEETEADTLYPSLSSTVSTTTFTTFYKEAKAPKPPVEEKPPKWKLDLPPRLQALLASQENEQTHFARIGSAPRVKLKFSPPARTIWNKPLPFSRYKNQRIKWYNHNMLAALPPLETEADYWDLHDLVTGKKEMPPLIPRRTPAKVSEEDLVQGTLEEESDLILEGPKPGPRLKDFQRGRPHEITPRFLQRMLSRAVLSQTPLVKTAAPGTQTEADSGLVFFWDDGIQLGQQEKATEMREKPVLGRQAELLFG
ncbi:hypothetical protein H2200_002360 [Cladophialophora chaetospira]|uniref:LYR motif-containing protein Cup1-like N-terminal domain-containing protein n=1 Tax=Cladophialophora chaetospira TaxID=386627 RepID=A0AA38XIV1_9EURO|nr:hypothetical protein H2200_002360 [Cladophialophora chaetospira]